MRPLLSQDRFDSQPIFFREFIQSKTAGSTISSFLMNAWMKEVLLTYKQPDVGGILGNQQDTLYNYGKCSNTDCGFPNRNRVGMERVHKKVLDWLKSIVY